MAPNQRMRGIVPAELEGERLDRAVARLFPELARAAARRAIDFGACWVNGKRVRRVSQAVSVGDRVAVYPEASERDTGTAAPRIVVLHVDGQIAVVDKPAGLVTAGTLQGDRNSAVTQLEEFLRENGYKRFDVQVVHRLDRAVSGLLVFALNKLAAAQLAPQFRDHSVVRLYWAVLEGAPPGDFGTIDRALRVRPHGTGSKAEVLPPGTVGAQAARSHWAVIERSDTKPGRAVVVARLETGRTHQLRAHLATLIAPIVGDAKYGSMVPNAGRLALHAGLLRFRHPATSGKILGAFGRGGIAKPGGYQPYCLSSNPPQDFWKYTGMSEHAVPHTKDQLTYLLTGERPERGA